MCIPEAAPQGDGAPDIDLATQRVIQNHFDNRWGQYPPLLEAEAAYLAKVVCSAVRKAAEQTVV